MAIRYRYHQRLSIFRRWLRSICLLRSIKRGHGLLSDHSSGGSDSSVLTIWAQTGILGVFSYLLIGFVATVVAIKRIWKKSDFDSYLQLGLLSGFAGMMIHSIFVNSLLYALMMVYLWVGLALMDESVG